MEFNLANILIGIAMLLVSGFAGHFWWTYRRMINRVEQAATKDYVKEQVILERTANLERLEIIQREMIQVKEENRGMADSVLKAVKGVEERLDTLMFHLLNDRNK